MDKEQGKINQNRSFKSTIKFISTVLSWTVFTLLIVCIILLFYYFISMRIYALKGDKYAPTYSLYTIVSPSMVPNINVYDVIIDLKVDEPEELKIGDVITFVSESTESMGYTVTHRIVSIMKKEDGSYSYVTKGDNNLIQDSAPVPYRNIIGKVALRIPQLGRIQIFIANSYGWLFLILIPALYIILKDLIKQLKKDEEGMDDTPILASEEVNVTLFEPFNSNASEDDYDDEDYEEDEEEEDNLEKESEEDDEDVNSDDLPDLK